MKLKVFVATYRPLLKLPQQCLRLHGDFAKMRDGGSSVSTFVFFASLYFGLGGTEFCAFSLGIIIVE